MRIYILNKLHTKIDYLDNESTDKYFWDDEVHEYLTGTISTFTFTTISKNSSAIVPGNNIAFLYNDRQYYFTIVKVDETETTKKVECYSLNLDFTNEIANVINRGIPDEDLESNNTYKKNIVWYIQQSLDRGYNPSFIRLPDATNDLTNEISNVTKALKFEDTSDTVLSRLYSLADIFEAELYFNPVLSSAGVLEHIDINIFHEHDDTHQGIGRNRTDVKCSYGVNVSGITRNIDITELYTAIRPYGETDGEYVTLDGTQLYVYTDGSRSYNLDPSKEVEYYTVLGDKNIYAPLQAIYYPSGTGSDYTVKKEFTDIKVRNKLFEYALKELKKISKPKIEYDIYTDIDVDIGDVITVQDQAFDQELYIECRVIEKTFSLIDKSNKKYVFSNHKELTSKIPDRILALELSKKIYSGHVSGSGWIPGEPGYDHQDQLCPGFATWSYTDPEIPIPEYQNESKLLITIDSESNNDNDNDITLDTLINGMRFDISMNNYIFKALAGFVSGRRIRPLTPEFRIGNNNYKLYYLNGDTEFVDFILDNYLTNTVYAESFYQSPEKIVLSLQYINDKLVVMSVKMSFDAQKELNILTQEVSNMEERIYNMINPVGKTVLFTTEQTSFPYGEWELQPKNYYPVSWDVIASGDEYIAAGLPNITGSINNINMRGSSSNSITKNGVFSDSSRRTGNYIGCSSPSGDSISTLDFDASNSNSIYGNSDTVRPQSRKYYFYTRVSLVQTTKGGIIKHKKEKTKED